MPLGASVGGPARFLTWCLTLGNSTQMVTGPVRPPNSYYYPTAVAHTPPNNEYEYNYQLLSYMTSYNCCNP